MKLRYLDGRAAKSWVEGLLRPGSLDERDAAQRKLLGATINLSGSKFVRFVEESIAPHAADGATVYIGDEVPHQIASPDPKATVQLVPGHMNMMPAKDIIRFYEYWRDITPNVAACPTFWGSTTLAAIESGYIAEPVWLCVDKNGSAENARFQIDRALKESEKQDWDSDNQTSSGKVIGIDGLTRRVLRWMMGPMGIRGSPTMYANCSLAKAWWCGMLAEQCAGRANGLDKLSAVKSLQWMWGNLAEYMAGGLPILREQTVLTALALWGNAILEGNNRTARKQAIFVFKHLGRVSEVRALGLLSLDAIANDINKVVPSSSAVQQSA